MNVAKHGIASIQSTLYYERCSSGQQVTPLEPVTTTK